MKKKLLHRKHKKNLIKTKVGRVNFFNPWIQEIPGFDATRAYLGYAHNLPNLSNMAINKFAIVQKYYVILTKFSLFVGNIPDLVQEFENAGTPLNRVFRQMEAFQLEHSELNDILGTPGTTPSLEAIRGLRFQSIVQQLGTRGKWLKTRIFKWCKTNGFEVTNIGLIQGEDLDPNEVGSVDSLETIEEAFSDYAFSLSPENSESSKGQLSLSSESIQHSERELSPRSDSLEAIEIDAINNWQVEASIFKPRILSSKFLGRNRYLALQPKLYFNKHSVGFKVDVCDSEYIEPSISLTYKKCMVGFKNHKNQSHLVLGKQISFKSIPTNFSIHGLVPLTFDKEKFLCTSKINVGVTKNLIDKMPLNSNLPELLSHNLGFQSKVIVNLHSFSKNNQESNTFSTKLVEKNLKTNIKTLKSSEAKGHIEGSNFDKSFIINPRFIGPPDDNLRSDNFNLNESIRPIQTIALDPYPSKLNGSESVASVSIGAAFFIIVVSPIVHFIKTRVFDKPC